MLISNFFKKYTYILKTEKKSFKEFFSVLPRRKNFIFEYYEEIYWWQIDFWIKIYRKKDNKFLLNYLFFFWINNKKIYYHWSSIDKWYEFLGEKFWDSLVYKNII